MLFSNRVGLCGGRSSDKGGYGRRGCPRRLRRAIAHAFAVRTRAPSRQWVVPVGVRARVACSKSSVLASCGRPARGRCGAQRGFGAAAAGGARAGRRAATEPARPRAPECATAMVFEGARRRGAASGAAGAAAPCWGFETPHPLGTTRYEGVGLCFRLGRYVYLGVLAAPSCMAAGCGGVRNRQCTWLGAQAAVATKPRRAEICRGWRTCLAHVQEDAGSWGGSVRGTCLP